MPMLDHYRDQAQLLVNVVRPVSITNSNLTRPARSPIMGRDTTVADRTTRSALRAGG